MTLSQLYNDCHGTMAAVHSSDREWERAHKTLHQEDWIPAKKRRNREKKNLDAKAR